MISKNLSLITITLFRNAIAISAKELAENNPDQTLEIAAMERKGADKFLLRVKTKPEANLSALSSEYFSNYNRYKGLSQAELRTLLIEQTTRVEG